MKDVMSVRLGKDILRRVKELAKRDQKEMSSVARELMDYGWSYLMIREYREGKVSLGTFADKLGIALSEAIDLLKDLGVRSPMEYDDYLKAYASAEEFVESKKPSER